MGRDKLGVWDEKLCSTVYKVDNKDLLHSTGSSTHYPLRTAYGGKNMEKM